MDKQNQLRQAVELTEQAIIGLDALQQMLDAAGPSRMECHGLHALLQPWIKSISEAHDELLKIKQ